MYNVKIIVFNEKYFQYFAYNETSMPKAMILKIDFVVKGDGQGYKIEHEIMRW